MYQYDVYRCHTPFVKFPSAYDALFLNSFGVAAGSAMMTARHSLLSDQCQHYSEAPSRQWLTLH